MIIHKYSNIEVTMRLSQALYVHLEVIDSIYSASVNMDSLPLKSAAIASGLIHMNPYGVWFLGCTSTWRVIDKFVQILRGAQVRLAVPLRLVRPPQGTS